MSIVGRSIAIGLVVERARQNPRRGRLADTAHAGQHVALGDPARRERIAQRPHHRLLPDQIVKGLRPVLARQHDIRSRRRTGAALILGFRR